MKHAMIASIMGSLLGAATPVAAQVSDSLLFQATLGADQVERLNNKALASTIDNSNTNPLFTVTLGSQLLFGVSASGSTTRVPDYLTATFGQDQTYGTFYTLADPNLNGTVFYPISTLGGNSYRELLTFNRLGSFTGSINLNLQLANPDFSQSGGAGDRATYREAPTLTFRVNVVDPASAVPEPATWATMVLGFLALGLLARRQAPQTVTA